ncbi:MAG: SAM-dependent chlorinase/fluorinase [Candidatus Thorarchaeota archaeon]|nr:SAM-dependent chlorinase/fluorinase [Candidatus Thorarchaeota archaeon]
MLALNRGDYAEVVMVHMIVLLTDFGESEYVGMMKGVIYSHCPSATVVDLTHSISPQSVIEAAWVLMHSHRLFPVETVFVCVVDPGVGTSRRAVLVQTSDYTFLAPDNGLLWPTVSGSRVRLIVDLEVPEDAAPTFHGRDVFARAAARLWCGTEPLALGSQCESLNKQLHFYLSGRAGQVVRIDRFGNIITNIPPSGLQSVKLVVGSKRHSLPFCRTYAEGPDSGLFVTKSSYGTLELTVKNGSANDVLEMRPGDLLELQ